MGFNFIFNKIAQKSAIGIAIGIAISVLIYFSLTSAIENIALTQPLVPYIKVIGFFILLFLGITVGLNKAGDGDKTYKKG